jgi:NAD(P)-dependent dehydrogenase (short-subunit alcohol dehydrogenase family)
LEEELMGEFSTRPPHAPIAPRQSRSFDRHRGKAFIVTGAAGGIGRATAALLLDEGASVVFADVRRDPLDAAVASLDKSRAIVTTLNASDPGSISAAIAEVGNKLGRIDGLVNCAAIVKHADPLEASWDDWSKIFSVNVFGAYEAARLAAKAMIANGTRGSIVNVASEAGKKGHKESLVYSASKAALISVTRMLSSALAAHDINVNCVCPGGVATDMLREVAVAYGAIAGAPPDEIFPKLVSSQLLRHIEPMEVARTISFLLSDDALIIRGQAVNADGGDTPY